ncbi:Acylphosphate phosphohydrolase, putative [Rhodovulum sp. PH10]|uniref:acylphosphatase n=1 Tax=Rhodovulum sp. PH10 TaxID=1187851 RepID=UPI00027C24CC|nr:acylphosphatase [Rhodovulum sp. PH10]EJW12766.1 Acylphosphate phosphohydrolase, putative [Rhodovulum sp. PH10]
MSAPDENRIARHLLIRGRVQGVGFRYWAASEAERRGLAGWVRNRRDGAVELVAAGPAEVVEDFVAACRRGPFRARVDRVEIDAAGEAERANMSADGSFAVLHTI